MGRSYGTRGGSAPSFLKRAGWKRKTFARPQPTMAQAMAVVANGAGPAAYMGLEKKFIDFRVDDDQFGSIWAGGEIEDATALSVSAVAQGDGENNRDGRVYWIHGIYIHGTIDLPATESSTSPDGDVIARVCLVWDKQTNGAQLNAEDVMLTVASGDDIDSYRNLQQVQRFSVLQDKKIRMVGSMAMVNEGSVNLFARAPMKKSFTLNYTFRKPLKVSCSGTAAAIASITDNSLHVIGVASDTAARCNYTSRLRFTG